MPTTIDKDTITARQTKPDRAPTHPLPTPPVHGRDHKDGSGQGQQSGDGRGGITSRNPNTDKSS